MEFKALSNGERSINIISSDGKIVFHVNPQYPLTRLIVDGCMDETLINKLGLEGQSRNNKLVKNCLTSESDLIYDCLEKAGLEKIIIAINSSSMTRDNIKTNIIGFMGEIASGWDISKRGARIRISIPDLKERASKLKSIPIERFKKVDLKKLINDVIKSNINEIASSRESVKKANLRSKQYKSLENEKYKLAEEESIDRNESKRIAEKKLNKKLKEIDENFDKGEIGEEELEHEKQKLKLKKEEFQQIENEKKLEELRKRLDEVKSKADGKVKKSAAKMASKAPAEKDDTKSIKIISGKITFRVSPEYLLSRFIIDGFGEGLMIDEEVKKEVKEYCLTSIKNSKLICDSLGKVGLKKIIIAINSSSMSKTKTGKKSGKKIYEKDIRGSIGKVIMECSVSRKGARIRLDIPELKRRPSKSGMEKLIKEMKRDSCEEIAMAIADIIKREFEPKYVEEANELS